MLGDKPVALVLDIDPNVPNLSCDKRRVRQVLLNLLSNAIKFTDQGTITFSAKKREDEILFAVIDTGPGIAADQQDIIFQPFVQTDTGIRHAGGTGLGLPISKQIVEAHQGRLWVESTPGEGAAFFVMLPLRVEPITAEKELQSG
jgi:signal transduction histidine kinase